MEGQPSGPPPAPEAGERKELGFAARQIKDFDETLGQLKRSVTQSEMIDPDSCRTLRSALHGFQRLASLKDVSIEDFNTQLSAITKGIEEFTNIRGRMPRRDDVEVFAMIPRSFQNVSESLESLYLTIKNEKDEEAHETLVLLGRLRDTVDQKRRGINKLLRGMDELR